MQSPEHGSQIHAINERSNQYEQATLIDTQPHYGSLIYNVQFSTHQACVKVIYHQGMTHQYTHDKTHQCHPIHPNTLRKISQ